MGNYKMLECIKRTLSIDIYFYRLDLMGKKLSNAKGTKIADKQCLVGNMAMQDAPLGGQHCN